MTPCPKQLCTDFRAPSTVLKTIVKEGVGRTQYLVTYLLVEKTKYQCHQSSLQSQSNSQTLGCNEATKLIIEGIHCKVYRGWMHPLPLHPDPFNYTMHFRFLLTTTLYVNEHSKFCSLQVQHDETHILVI